MKKTIHDDFDLEKIIYSGQCFRPSYYDGIGRFTYKNKILYVKQLSDCEYDFSCSKDEFYKIWSTYFDFEREYASIRKSAKDKFLKQAAEFSKGIRILKQDKFETLISFIISQRKSIPAIRSSVEKLCEKYGEKITFENDSFYAFPSPKALANAKESDLATCGLGYRVPYIKDASMKVASGEYNLESFSSLSDDELFSALKEIKGIGDKVANCVMLFAYGRTSRAPIDTWIQKIMDTYYDGSNPFPQYKEAAGIMQQYSFYYIQNHKSL